MVEKADAFAELGDALPLYRCVSRPLAVSFVIQSGLSF